MSDALPRCGHYLKFVGAGRIEITPRWWMRLWLALRSAQAAKV